MGNSMSFLRVRMARTTSNLYFVSVCIVVCDTAIYTREHRTVGRSENPGEGTNCNVEGIICQSVEIGLTDVVTATRRGPRPWLRQPGHKNTGDLYQFLQAAGAPS